MLNKLFRPKWQHETPEVRKAAIEKLSANDLDILKQIATTDTVEDIRRLALSKIDTPNDLLQMADNASSAKLKQQILRSWAQLLADNHKVPAFDAEQWVTECTDSEKLNAIIAYSGSQNLENLALAGLTDEPSLLALIENSSHKVRQAAVSKLHSEQSLKTALQLVKGKDKKSAQAIKAKLEEIKIGHEQQALKQHKLDKLIEKLKYLTDHEAPLHLEGELMAVKALWQQFDDDKAWIDGTTQSGIEESIAHVQQKVDAIKTLDEENAAFAKQQAMKKAEAAALQAELFEHIEAIGTWPQNSIEELQSRQQALTESFQSHEDVLDKGEYRQLRNLLDEASHQLSAIALVITHQEKEPKLEDDASPKAIKSRVHWIRQLLEALQEISNRSPLALEEALQKELSTLQQKASTASADEKKHSQEVQQWLEKAEEAIDTKQVDDGRRYLSKARNACQQLGDNKAHRFQATLARLSGALRDLEDWKRFSTDPKRQALCDAMEKLADVDLPAQDKAREIHQLQDQWKALGYCQDHQLWDHFKSLAEKAYQPCKDVFEQQKAHRAFNAEQRHEICEQLAAYLAQHDWDNTDWQALDKLYQNVVTEWKRFSPVERDEHEKLQKRFDETAGVVKSHLQTHKKANLALLEELCEKATALDAEEDLHQAIDSYQALLGDWKAVGLVYHKQRQQLWQKFKTAGDALYEKRNSQRQSADAHRQEELDTANRLLNEMDALVPQIETCADQDNLKALKQSFQAHQNDFNGLTDLPNKAKGAVKKRFDSLSAAYQSALKIQKQLSWLTQFENLMAASLAQAEAEQKGESTSLPETLPNNWQQVMKARIESPQATSAEDAHTKAIAIEIALDIESPAEDSEKRMSMQMERLADGIGQGRAQNPKEALDTAIIDWVGQPFWPSDDSRLSYETLTERFANTVRQHVKSGK